MLATDADATVEDNGAADVVAVALAFVVAAAEFWQTLANRLGGEVGAASFVINTPEKGMDCAQHAMEATESESEMACSVVPFPNNDKKETNWMELVPIYGTRFRMTRRTDYAVACCG